jgi:hypothetical protein
MDTRASGVVRWARATVLGVVVLTLGAVAHVQGDGHLPGAVGLAFLGLLTVAACAAWLGRPAGAVRLVVMTTVGQAGVHALLSLTAGHAGATPRPTPSGGPVRAPFGPEAAPSGVTTAEELDLGPLLHVLSDMVDHAPMALAHLVAAVAVGLWLAVGERSLWTLVALAARQLLAPVALLAAAVLPRPVAVRRGAPRPLTTAAPRLATLSRVVVRRGPPALLPA